MISYIEQTVMGQSVAQVCLMSTYYHFMVIITIPLLLLLSLPYHHCYCYSILFLERRVMRQTEGLFDFYSWLLFSDHNSHSSLYHFKLLLLSYNNYHWYFFSIIIIVIIIAIVIQPQFPSLAQSFHLIAQFLVQALSLSLCAVLWTICSEA